MFFNEDGWPVITPYRYTGETMGTYTKDDLAGTYKYINHGRDISPKIRESVLIELKKTERLPVSWKAHGSLRRITTLRLQWTAIHITVSF